MIHQNHIQKRKRKKLNQWKEDSLIKGSNGPNLEQIQIPLKIYPASKILDTPHEIESIIDLGIYRISFDKGSKETKHASRCI